jgi:glutamate synthase domain-containing protein 1
MVVDYAANGNVCRIQLPSIAPGREPGVRTPQAVDDFLAELVPLKMRGKELGRLMESYGAPSVSRVEYENVAIADTLQAQRRIGVTVTFTKEECRDKRVQ